MRKNLEERQAAMRERLAREASGAQMRPVQSVHPVEGFERPYTVREIAKMTGFSAQTVIRIFSQERGVYIGGLNRARSPRTVFPAASGSLGAPVFQSCELEALR